MEITSLVWFKGWKFNIYYFLERGNGRVTCTGLFLNGSKFSMINQQHEEQGVINLTEEKKVYDITIIGGGPVGLFTVLWGMRRW
jgi:hypothetical protein